MDKLTQHASRVDESLTSCNHHHHIDHIHNSPALALGDIPLVVHNYAAVLLTCRTQRSWQDCFANLGILGLLSLMHS